MIVNLPIAQQSIKDLGLGSKSVISVNEDEKAFTAFRLMLKHVQTLFTNQSKKISAVGVLNSAGMLVGTLSVTDFKVIFYAKIVSFSLVYWK